MNSMADNQKVYQAIKTIADELCKENKTYLRADLAFELKKYGIASDSSEVSKLVFDAYRYGKSNVYLREYFRLNRYMTVSWFGSINLSGDSPNDKAFQENAFYISFGPDDIKFSLGYDFIRQNTFFLVELMMNAKGTTLDYDRLEIKQDKKAKKSNNSSEDKNDSDFQQSNKAPVLQHAVVEDVKNVEDVL